MLELMLELMLASMLASMLELKATRSLLRSAVWLNDIRYVFKKTALRTQQGPLRPLLTKESAQGVYAP